MPWCFSHLLEIHNSCDTVFPELLHASAHSLSPLSFVKGTAGSRALMGGCCHPRAGPTARLESPGTNRWPFGSSSLAPPPCKKQMAPGSADHLEECPPGGNHTVGHRRDLLPSSAFGSAPSQLSKQRLFRLGSVDCLSLCVFSNCLDFNFSVL